MKKIDLMETGISLARLFRLALKNWIIISLSFIVGLGLGYGYTISPLMDQGTYQGTGSVAYRVSTNATVLNTITEIVLSRNVAVFAETALASEEEPVTLANGDPITVAIIQSTLTATTTTNSLRITITFTHPEAAIVVPVINAVIDASIADGNANYPVIANNLILGQYATTTTFDGPSTTLYLAIGALLGLMIGGVVGVLWDAFKGTIYSRQDLLELSLSAFYANLIVRVPLTFNTLLRRVGFKVGQPLITYTREQLLAGAVQAKAFIAVQNNLESTRPEPNQPLTTLLTTPKPFLRLPKVALAYAMQSALQGRKTLLIDFDLAHTPLSDYLDQLGASFKKKGTAKSPSPLLSVRENLDVYLPNQEAIPAKIIRSETMEAFIKKVKGQYDHIVIIGPSVLPDASVLSVVGYVNSAVIVAQAVESSTTSVVKTFNVLVDANIVAIETLIVEESTVATLPWLVSGLKAFKQLIKRLYQSFLRLIKLSPKSK